MKSPRIELIVMAALLLSAMAAFVWMQRSTIKAKAANQPPTSTSGPLKP
jgi:hypothetical protein